MRRVSHRLWPVLLVALTACFADEGGVPLAPAPVPATPTTPATPPGTSTPPTACQPRTCAASFVQCGVAPDGCGQQVDCGACGAGEGCVQSRCQRCLEDPCAAAGAQCGEVSDGCGGTVTCGPCAPGTWCGGGGAPHACGTGLAQGRVTGWAQVQGLALWHVTGLSGGDVVLAGRADGSVALARVAADGTVRWTRSAGAEMHYPHRLWPVRGSDDVLVVGIHEPPEAQFGNPVVLHVTAEGELKPDSSACWDCGIGTVDSEAGTGRRLSFRTSDMTESANYARPPGVGFRWTHDWMRDGDAGFVPLSGGLMPREDAVVALHLSGVGTLAGRTFGAEGTASRHVVRVDDTGQQLRWSLSLPPATALGVVQVSDAGRVLLSGSLDGPVQLAGRALRPVDGERHSRLVLALDPDGTQVWARALPLWNGGLVALAPDGRAAFASTYPGARASGCSVVRVDEYAADGSLRWSRTLGAPACEGSVSASGITYADGDVVVAGHWRGTVDFGAGRRAAPDESTPAGTGYVLRLRGP